MPPQTTRLAFMGTPEFSVQILEALIKAGYNVVAVYTQPERPVGRGYKLTPTPVHQSALAYDIPVFTPESLVTKEAQEGWKSLSLDVAIVAAYGLLLPKEILEAPQKGCLNVHASLLPRWRGASPIQRAILEGDQETGVTIMKMDEGLDTGDIVLKKETPILPTTTTPSLFEELAKLGSSALLEALPAYLDGDLQPVPQPKEGVTYAEKLKKEEGQLDWNLSAEELDRKVRALNPWPGTWFMIGDELIKVLEAEVIKLASKASPGAILDKQYTIQCAENAVRLLRVQKRGRAPMPAVDFFRGFELMSNTL